MGEINTEFVNDRQVGGSHYRSDYQHWDWSRDMNLGRLEYAASKYVSRWWKKNGLVDLEKAKHYVEKVLSDFLSGEEVRTGSDRLEGSTPALISTLKYSFLNDLSPQETMFCWLMSSWLDEDDLRGAIAVLDHMLGAPRVALNGRQQAGSTAGLPPVAMAV